MLSPLQTWGFEVFALDFEVLSVRFFQDVIFSVAFQLLYVSRMSNS